MFRNFGRQNQVIDLVCEFDEFLYQELWNFNWTIFISNMWL